MNHMYRFHPDEYALGDNEKFYSDMEARGWRLQKRGQHLSKFVRTEPSRARYRIEVSAPGFLEEPHLPEEQLAVYEDCGWEYVTDQGLLYIFRAPEGSDAPEFYADPRQQAATLKKLRRGYVWAWVPVALALGFNLLLTASMQGGLGDAWADVRRTWVEGTALALALAAWLVWAVYQMLRGAWSISRTYRRMKRGVPLDHSPGGRRLAHKIINRGLLAMIALCLLLAAAQWMSTKKYDLPQAADGPYLLLEELGHTGERGHLFYSDRTSRVEVSCSLSATHWDVFEVVEDGGGQTWMYQDAYRLRWPADPMDFARTLMDTATFARSAADFTPVEAEGLDAAWLCGDLELIAVKGDMVIYVDYQSHGQRDDSHLRALLPVLAERWSVSVS